MAANLKEKEKRGVKRKEDQNKDLMEAENQNPPENTATAGASSAIDEIAKELKRMNIKMDQLMLEVKKGYSSSKQASEAMKLEEEETRNAKKVLIRNSKSVEKILRYMPEMSPDLNTNYFTCATCTYVEKVATGNIKYDFDLGVDFTKTNQTR